VKAYNDLAVDEWIMLQDDVIAVTSTDWSR